MFKRTFPAALAVTASLALVACGGGSSEPADTIPAGALTVTGIEGLKLDLASYSATAGSVAIAYVNQSNVNHTLVVLGSDSKQIGTKLKIAGGAGKTDVGTYELPAGEYTLFCDVAGHENMKASLTVG